MRQNRILLVGVLLLGIVLAGCIDSETTDGEADTPDIEIGQHYSVSVGETEVRTERTNEMTQRVSVGGVDIFEVPIIYEEYHNWALNQKIKQDTLNTISSNIFQTYIVKVDTGDLPEYVVESRRASIIDILDQVEQRMNQKAQEQFDTTLKLQETEQTPDVRSSAPTVVHRRFNGEYQYSSESFDVRGETIEIPGQSVNVRGDMYAWDCPQADSKFVVVGVYPGESVRQTSTHQLSDAISINVDLDLAIPHNQFHRELKSIAGSVQCN